MNSSRIRELLILAGWEESYLNTPLEKYYRFRIETPHGWEHVYVNRYSSDAMLCLHSRFLESRRDFHKLPGVEIGGIEGLRIMKSADMRDFKLVEGGGKRKQQIAEFFPLRFLTESALKSAIAELARQLGVREIGGQGSVSLTTSEESKEPDLRSSPESKASDNSEEMAPTIPADKEQAQVIPASAQSGLESDTPSLNTAEREAVVKVRFGQGSFRLALFEERGYGDKCWMSGIEGGRLLIASHIKPWSHCESDTDSRGRTDNGLLLSALWDAAFDAGFITFDPEWNVVASSKLSESAKCALNLSKHSALPDIFRTEGRKDYLAYHHANVFEYWIKKDRL